MTDRLVLAIDLSSPRGVIAVVRGETLLHEAVFQSERSHNAQLFAPLAAALEVMGREPAVLVVGTGPGSYTGVRISIAAAQGVALSRGWPLVGWSSISAVDLPHYQVLGDARRGQFYRAQVKNGVLLAAPAIITPDEARAAAEEADTWVTLDAKAPLALENIAVHSPDAAQLGRLIARLSESELSQASAPILEPVYLQEAFITVAKKAGKHVPVHRDR
ncbi:MAG: tRNA ((37)-N6)-threonylcarbamoyltransferase complex dimerization subunit type 1 TsaB [Verrucomicrobiota bacterium]|jgi:tRNA threonylcarbamoyl adenosine modification protein YeaZ